MIPSPRAKTLFPPCSPRSSPHTHLIRGTTLHPSTHGQADAEEPLQVCPGQYRVTLPLQRSRVEMGGTGAAGDTLAPR
jgi:hypothetical protein